jgi:hypothetical protein
VSERVREDERERGKEKEREKGGRAGPLLKFVLQLPILSTSVPPRSQARPHCVCACQTFERRPLGS